MTIPIQTPQLGSTGLVPAGPNIVEIIAHAIQKRQELEQARAELAQKREEFELNKKIAGTQLAGMELDQEKKKRDFKAQEEDLQAQDEALRLFTGGLAQHNDPAAWGTIIAGVKDKRVATHLMGRLSEMAALQNATTHPSQVVPTAEGTYGLIDTRDATTRQTNLHVPPDAASRRIPVVTEREKASAAVSSIRANAAINQLETADPTIGQRVARKAALRKSVISGLMRRLTGTSQEDANLLAESQIEQSMSPEELQYYVAGKQLLSGILPGLSGKQVTAREYVMHAPAYLSMGSTNPEVVKSRARARATRIKSFMAEAGDAMAERLPELQDVDLTPYGLGTVVLPDSSVHHITPGKARFHPRFHTVP